MKLRIVLFMPFCVLALAPIVLLWAVPHSQFLHNGYAALAVLAGGTAAAVFFAVAVAMFISRPINEIIATSKRMASGDVSARIDAGRGKLVPAEFYAVQESFNAMAGQLHQNINHIQSLAFIDSVTGLANRECFRKLVESNIAKLDSAGGHGAMVFMDLDGFKKVNDELGHDIGDELLMHFAHRVSNVLKVPLDKSKSQILNRDNGQDCQDCHTTFARVGGDEFVAFLPNVEDDEAVLNQIEEILEVVRMPFLLGNNEVFIGSSVGVARFPSDGESYKQILGQADAAMYRAKRSGKNTVCLFDRSRDTSAADGHRLGRELRDALRRDELSVCYQPRISCQDGRVSGLEALVRWQHPERGLLHSASFVPFIEASDVLVGLGEWVLKDTVKRIQDLAKKGRPIPISVNISVKHFASSSFAERVIEIVNEVGIEPSLLEIEVTEAVVLSDLDRARTALEKIRGFGIRVAIDDFGKGNSNLAGIAYLPFDILKIDVSFIANITTDARIRVILESIVELAAGLNCITVAEGVETKEQALCLKELGCDQMQGFFNSTPMALEEMEDWLGRQESCDVSNLQDVIVEKFQAKVA